MNLLEISSQWINTLSLAINSAMLAWHSSIMELIACPSIIQLGLDPVRAVSNGLGIDKNTFMNWIVFWLFVPVIAMKAKQTVKMPVTEPLTQLPSLISRPSLPTAGFVLLRISRKNMANKLVNTKDGTNSTNILSKCYPVSPSGVGGVGVVINPWYLAT